MHFFSRNLITFGTTVDINLKWRNNAAYYWRYSKLTKRVDNLCVDYYELPISAGMFDINVMPHVRYFCLIIRLSFNAVIIFNMSKLFVYNLHYTSLNSVTC